MKSDVVIIGGGPAGLSLARTLAESELSVQLVERAPESALADPKIDGRDIALTHHSMELLDDMGVLARLPDGAVSPIREAHVVNGDSSYPMVIDGASRSVDALGYLVPNYLIRKALFEEVKAWGKTELITECGVNRVAVDEQQASVELTDGRQLSADLVVAADSRFSESRRKMGISADMLDFGRVVIVSRMEHEKPHDAIAFECFHYGHTLAVLPLSGNLSSIVVTVSAEKADHLLKMPAEQFSQLVKRWFNHRLGEMRPVGERYSYPLVAVHANRFVKPRYALLGDAAVGMHPVTAHGFNLGLRGQESIATEITRARRKGRDIGSISVLQRYEARHMRVTRPLYRGTNEIVTLFTNESIPAKIARSAVLRVSNNLPPLKSMIAGKLAEKGEQTPLPIPSFLF